MKTSRTFHPRAIAGLACALMVWAATMRVASGAVPVYGEASSSGPVITVNLFADITNAPLISFGVQLSFDPQALSVQSAVKNTTVWYFSDGASQVRYMDPDVSIPGTVRFVGGKLDGLNPLQGVSGPRVLLGSVTFKRLASKPIQFSLALGQPAPFANFVTTSGSILDGAPDGVVLKGVQTDPNDTDLNGLPDAWELNYFGHLGVAWDDDPDHDGFNNRQEYEADTNPTSGSSYPRIRSVAPVLAGFQVQWQGGVQATQYLQRCFTLTNGNNLWLDISTSLPPTPITGSYTDLFDIHGSKFYRVRFNR